MKNKSLTVVMKLFVIVILVVLVGVSAENNLMSRNSGLDVVKEYETKSSNEVTSPLKEMDINNKNVKIAVVGKAQIAEDKNNKSTELLNPKQRYQFIGDYKFNDYIINFNDENPLISTELQLDGKWCIYASAIAETTTLINGTHYFLGVTVMHDKDYNIESLSFNIFNTDKSLVGQYTFKMN